MIAEAYTRKRNSLYQILFPEDKAATEQLYYPEGKEDIQENGYKENCEAISIVTNIFKSF
jgi:hypothetical protein